MHRALLLCLSLSLSLLFVAPQAKAQAENPKIRVEEVRDGLYRWTAGNYHSVFLVTDDGILVGDPLSRDAATQLKALLAERFNQPVRYLVQSHSHVDHALGAEILAGPETTVIAQTLAREDMERTRLPTRLADLSFDEHMTLRIGGQPVQLRYWGPNNGRGSITMYFEQQRVLHVVDWITLGRLPYKDLAGYDVSGMIDSTRGVLGTDFDLIVGGHADIGDRADVEHFLGYVEALFEAVREGMLAGKSLETLQDEIRLEDYRDLKMYDEWLPENIAGVWRELEQDAYFGMRPDVKAARGG